MQQINAHGNVMSLVVV